MKIAILGAPGSGKSTISAGLFYELKQRGISVEIIPELIKYKVYKKEDFSKAGMDICNTLEQAALESVFDFAIKQGDLDLVVCEAPLCNGYIYASFYGKDKEVPILKDIAQEKVKQYNHIFLMKRTIPYKSFGRLEDEKTSDSLYFHIRSRLDILGVNWFEITSETSPKLLIEMLNLNKKGEAF